MQHTVALMLAMFSMWLVHEAYMALFDEQARFFNWIPVRWAFDAAHVVLFGKFTWHLARQIWK